MLLEGEGGDEPGGSLWLYGSNGDSGRMVHWDSRCMGRGRDWQQQGWDVAFCEEQESESSAIEA
jgi:hypothetical protein